MAQAKPEKKPTPRRRKKKVAEPGSKGLSAREVGAREPTTAVRTLMEAIETDGGRPLAAYREPLGGHWVILSALPVEQVAPTPYQRNISESHVDRLTEVIGKTDRYLDPVISVRTAERQYQSPNGHHRLQAMRNLGARSITSLVVADPEVARLILALNVEKAHNLREKSLEVIRLARGLAGTDDDRESAFALEFDEPSLLTLGCCYEKNGRFGGGAYHPLLKRVEKFSTAALSRSLVVREERADRLLAIEKKVAELVKALRAQGLESPTLRYVVVARLNPIRFQRGAKMPVDEAIEKMEKAAEKFDPAKISVADLARSAGRGGE